MAFKSILAAGVAVILGGVLAATPAGAGEPTINVVDDPHDVAIPYPGNSPVVAATEAELRSIEIKWFKATPRTDGTVRFKVKIHEVRGTTFSQRIQFLMVPVVTTSTGDWVSASFVKTIGPNAGPAYASLSNPEQIDCKPRVRVNRAADTVRMDVPNACVPVGDAMVTASTVTEFVRGDPIFGHRIVYGSMDEVWVYEPVR